MDLSKRYRLHKFLPLREKACKMKREANDCECIINQDFRFSCVFLESGLIGCLKPWDWSNIIKLLISENATIFLHKLPCPDESYIPFSRIREIYLLSTSCHFLPFLILHCQIRLWTMIVSQYLYCLGIVELNCLPNNEIIVSQYSSLTKKWLPIKELPSW